MKKLIKKITMVGLIGLMVLGNAVTINAKVIQGTKGRTYITLDSIEKRENKEDIKRECTIQVEILCTPEFPQTLPH